jgi:hypothetical protein
VDRNVQLNFSTLLTKTIISTIKKMNVFHFFYKKALNFADYPYKIQVDHATIANV